MDPSVERSGSRSIWPPGLCEEDLAQYGAAALSDREIEAISLRCGGDGKPSLTLKEVGERLDIGPERVRQIVLIAVSKLSHEKHGGGVFQAHDDRLAAARRIARNQFGLDLRESRESRSCTQAQLSARTAIPVAAIKAIERGVGDLGLLTLVKLASALEMTLDELLRNYSWRIPGESDFGVLTIKDDEVWPQDRPAPDPAGISPPWPGESVRCPRTRWESGSGRTSGVSDTVRR
jgi:transcriptional regulator with XRE-family HTH domain/DNA-binding CsgD family transcriptional regulator